MCGEMRVASCVEINLLLVLAALSLIGGAGGQFGPLAFQMIQRKGEHLIRDGAILELHPKFTNKDMYIYISKLLFCPPNYLTDLDELLKYLLSTIKIFYCTSVSHLPGLQMVKNAPFYFLLARQGCR